MTVADTVRSLSIISSSCSGIELLLIIFNSKHQLRINEELRLQVGKNTVFVAPSAKNLEEYILIHP